MRREDRRVNETLLGKRRRSSQQCQRGEGAPLRRERPFELVVEEAPAAVFEKESSRGDKRKKDHPKERKTEEPRRKDHGV